MAMTLDDIHKQNAEKERSDAALRDAAKKKSAEDDRTKARSATNQGSLGVAQSFVTMLQSGKNPQKALASLTGFGVNLIKLAFTAAAEIGAIDRLHKTTAEVHAAHEQRKAQAQNPAEDSGARSDSAKPSPIQVVRASPRTPAPSLIGGPS